LDPIYELEGVDLPIGDVRWTQKRNLQEFLRLLSIQSVDVQPLITHRVAISEAQQVYAQFMSGTLVQPIGVLLEYPANANTARHFALPSVQLNPNTHPLGLRNLQVGVIGAGLFGKALLLPALEKLPNITLHTLVTSSGVSAEHTARKFGFRHQSTDTESVWQSTEIDAVIGLTPHSQHARLVQSAIEHNKALFLEKPLCVTEKELTDLHALASNRKTLPILTIGHNRRFSPHTIRMQEWLAGRQGPCVIHMRVNTGFIPRSHWVHSEDEGRSRIVGEMSHFIDLIQSLTSAEMIRVSAERISADDHSAVNNDNVVVNFKLSDGSVGSLL
jgi:hypothetical protein